MGSALKHLLENHTLAFFLQDLSQPGGTEKVMTTWCNHFVNSGFQVELVSEPSSSIFFPIDALVAKSFLNLDADKGIKKNPLILLKRIYLCKKWLVGKKNHFLIIDKSVYLLPFLILKFFRMLGEGNRVIYYSHNSASMFEARFAKAILRFIYNICDLVLCLYHDPAFRPVWPGHQPQVLPNPCPFRITSFEPSVPRPKKALYVGRFSEEKGLEIIIQAWQQLKNSDQLHGWKLVLLGDGPLKASLQTEIKKKNLSDCIEIYLPTTEVQPFYQDAGLFLMASIYEGMPLVMLEAKEASLPIISTVNDGALFLIKDGIDGTIVADRNPSSYAQALVRYFLSEDLRKRHALASRESAAEYSLTQITQTWVNYLSTIK